MKIIISFLILISLSYVCVAKENSISYEDMQNEIKKIQRAVLDSNRTNFYEFLPDSICEIGSVRMFQSLYREKYHKNIDSDCLTKNIIIQNLDCLILPELIEFFKLYKVGIFSDLKEFNLKLKYNTYNCYLIYSLNIINCKEVKIIIQSGLDNSETDGCFGSQTYYIFEYSDNKKTLLLKSYGTVG